MEEVNSFLDVNFISIFMIAATTFLVFIYIIYKQTKIKKQIMAEIQNDILPRKGIVSDILIYKYLTNRAKNGYHSYYEFYPIVKDIANDKFYVSFQKYDYSNYRTYNT